MLIYVNFRQRQRRAYSSTGENPTVSKVSPDHVFDLVEREKFLRGRLQESYPGLEYKLQAEEFLENVAYARIQLREALGQIAPALENGENPQAGYRRLRFQLHDPIQPHAPTLAFF